MRKSVRYGTVAHLCGARGGSLQEIKAILCERLPELDADFWNLTAEEGSDAGGVDFVTART